MSSEFARRTMAPLYEITGSSLRPSRSANSLAEWCMRPVAITTVTPRREAS